MQRIALPRILVVGAFVTVAVSGCTTPAPQPRRPLPAPPIVTRKPQPLPPPVVQPQPRPAPPPVVQPRPEPAPSGAVDLAAIRPPRGIRRGQWKVIVVHHSEKANATPQGMDSYHRQRGWENGLGYHFVIGNGVNYPDGKLFVGPRWSKQQTGAHCKAGAGKYFGIWRASNFFNENGIGICLIGNFESGLPTPRQQATLRKLITLLCSETGVSPSRVYGHGEVTHGTLCPGRNFSVAALRSALASSAAANVGFDDGVELARTDLDDAPAAHRHAYHALLGAHPLAKGVDVVYRVVGDALDYITDPQVYAAGRAVGCDVDHDDAAGAAAHALAVFPGDVREP